MEPSRDGSRIEVETHQLLPSRSSLQINANSIRSQNASLSNASDEATPTAHGEASPWMPFALRWHFIAIPTGLAFVLAVVILVLHWSSQKHQGLGSESGAMAGWRFLPTLIAVVYTQLSAMMLGAVKRTEPFARLAKPDAHVPVARYTLLEKSRPWWTTLSHGFQKRRHGGSWNWTVISTCAVYILAMIGISPLSAALLTTKEVQVSSALDLSRLVPNRASTLSPRAERATYLRTTGAVLQNYSTSAWVTGEHFILPFWPPVYTGSPWDYRTETPQILEAETTVYQNDFVCSKLSMESHESHLETAIHYFGEDASTRTYNNTDKYASVLFSSDDGCRLNLTLSDLDTTYIDRDFAFWSDIQRPASLNVLSKSSRVILNPECPMNELILMSTPWFRFGNDTVAPFANLSVRAYACRSDHSMAVMSAQASSTPGGLSVSFDRGLYERTRKPVPSGALNMSQLHAIYTDPNWYEFILQESITDTSAPALSGAAGFLGTEHSLNISEMMKDPDIPQIAAAKRRHFFAEVMRTTISSAERSEEEPISGIRRASERRIVVNKQVAYAICVLLLVSFCGCLAIAGTSRRSKRPLNLPCDPGSVLGLMSMVVSSTTAVSVFKSMDLSSRRLLKTEFADRRFSTVNGGFHEVKSSVHDKSEDSPFGASTSSSSVLPAIRVRNLLGLLAYVLTIAVALAVLFTFAQRSDLRQGFFTYHANLEFLGDTASFSPFAIIPTLLSVAITLWWDSIDNACRSLQPYVAMSHRSTKPSQGIGLTYASTFWLWTSFKSLRRKHWLLTLVSLGAFLVQVLTISMSALFESSSGSVTKPVELSQSLEPRHIPFVHTIKWGISPLEWQRGPIIYFRYDDAVLKTLNSAISGLETQWMYTAMIQAALDGPEPRWSRDGWSFVPLETTTLGKTGSMSDDDTTANVTVHTPSIRARIECSIVEEAKNISLWLEDEPLSMFANISGHRDYYLPKPAIFEGNLTTRLTAQANYPQCCANLSEAETVNNNSLNPVVLAYWTENWNSSRTTGNFTVKWARGAAGFADIQSGGSINMYFLEPPVMQALNCMPIIETAQAEVTVDYLSSNVEGYRILNEPVTDDVAWSDAFQYRNLTERPHWRNASDEIDYDLNVTTSYGIMFMKSLLRAACLLNIGNGIPYDVRAPFLDRLEDKVFNMRDNQTGLNLDFMSYASYAQVKQDPTALLDPQTLLQTSQRVFSTFFQHFVSNDISHDHGGWAYQPIGLDLQVAPPMNNMPTQYLPNGTVAPRFEDTIPRNTSRTATAMLSTHVEILQMSPTAFWISISILIWLLITIIISASVQRRYFGGIQRNVECIADVLVLIAGSERLLSVIKEKGIDTIIKEDRIHTRLGWFRDPDGTMRWRIELVDDEDVQMRAIPLGAAYAPVPGEDDGVTESGVRSSRVSLPG